jgi:hypothetical protein
MSIVSGISDAESFSYFDHIVFWLLLLFLVFGRLQFSFYLVVF